METDRPRQEEERSKEEELVRQTEDELEPAPPSPELVLAELLELEEDPAKKELFAQFLILSKSSPVPFPESVRGYNEAVEGGGQWLLDYSKTEQKHRHKMDDRRARYFWSGQLFGFILALVGIGGGLFLASTGAAWFGFSAFFASLISLVGLFVYNKREERGEKKRSEAQSGAEDNG